MNYIGHLNRFHHVVASRIVTSAVAALINVALIFVFAKGVDATALLV